MSHAASLALCVLGLCLDNRKPCACFLPRLAMQTCTPFETGAALADRPLKAVTDQADAIYSVVLAYRSEQVQIVQANDMLEESLTALGLASKQQLAPRQVGIEPSNRGTAGVNALAVQILASDILEVGWSMDATRHACCIREKPDSTRINDFTLALCRGTDLADPSPGEIVAGAFGCTHTNMVLRNIACAAPSTHPEMSSNGRFDLVRLEQKDARYAAAARAGLTWLVLDWRVKVWYPDVVDIMSAARNVGQTLSRSEDEMSVLLRVHKTAAEIQQSAGTAGICWETIKRSIVRTRPPCAAKLESMISFVIARSGGLDGEHVRYLAAFFRNCVEAPLRHGVPASLYEQLAHFRHHFLALAILETAWTCPEIKVIDKECQFVTGADVAALARLSKTEQGGIRVEAAEKLCRGFRDVLRKTLAGAPSTWSNDMIVHLATYDCLVGRYILGKQVGVKVFASLADIATEFAKELLKLQPNLDHASAMQSLRVVEGSAPGKGSGGGASAAKAEVKPQNSVCARLRVAATKSPNKQQVVGLYELDAKGDCTTAIGQLRAKGWDLGFVLLLDGTHAGYDKDEVFTISSVSETSVALSQAGPDGQKPLLVLTCETFLQQARQVPAGRVVLQSDWASKRVRSAKAFVEATVKARVLTALDTLSAGTCPDLENLVVIRIKPHRDVVAVKDLEIGQLVLVPETPRVNILEVAALKRGLEPGEQYHEAPMPREVFLTGLPEWFKAHRVVLQPAGAADGACPYWSLEPAKNADEINLVEVLYCVQLCNGCDPWPQHRAPMEVVTPGAAGKGWREAAWAPLAHAICKQAAVPTSALAAVAKTTAVAKSPPAKTAPPTGWGKAKGDGKAAATSKAAAVASPGASAPGAASSSVPGAVNPVMSAHHALVQQVQRHDGQGEVHEKWVFIPVFVNCVAVKEGDALRPPCEPKKKEKSEMKAINVSQVLKKARKE